MAQCKKCGTETTSKNGIVRGKQRYKCEQCGHNFTEGDGRKKPAPAIDSASDRNISILQTNEPLEPIAVSAISRIEDRRPIAVSPATIEPSKEIRWRSAEKHISYNARKVRLASWLAEERKALGWWCRVKRTLLMKLFILA